MNARRFRHCWLSLLVAALTVTPLASAQPGPLGPARGGPAAGRDVVVIANDSALAGAVPLFENTWISHFIRTPTAMRDSSWKLSPVGVEALPSAKDGTLTLSGDRMILRWRMRRRNWHDGRPVTCGDFVFALHVARDERVPLHWGDRPKGVTHLVCPKGDTDLEVVVTWSVRHPFALLDVMHIGPLPRHLLERHYRTNPGRLLDAYGQDPTTTIGDGPYRLIEFRRGVSLTLEAVPDHSIFGTPKIKRIILRRVPRDEILPLLRSGELDIGFTGGPPNLRQLQELAELPPDRFRVLFESGSLWEHLDFNLSHPLLQDLRVRRAIAHGINRTLIVHRIYKGKIVVPSHTIFSPQHPGYTDDVQRYPYDPSRARALLRQAGFAPGPDGVMRSAEGQRLVLEISTTTDGPSTPERDLVELMIQEQLRLIGIEVTIVNFPFRQFWGQVMQRRQYKGLALYSWVNNPTTHCWRFVSSQIPTEANGWQGDNLPGYVNAKVDRLCTGFFDEIDEAQRAAMLRRAAQILARDLPAFPLYFRPQAVAAKAGLQNFSWGYPCSAGCTVSPTWNAHQWAWR